jgi:hypothetical protein
MVMRANLGAAEPSKEALGLVGAGGDVRIAFLMINAFRKESLMQNIPTGSFVGMNGRVAVNGMAVSACGCLAGMIDAGGEDLAREIFVTALGQAPVDNSGRRRKLSARRSMLCSPAMASGDDVRVEIEHALCVRAAIDQHAAPNALGRPRTAKNKEKR